MADIPSDQQLEEGNLDNDREQEDEVHVIDTSALELKEEESEKLTASNFNKYKITPMSHCYISQANK